MRIFKNRGDIFFSKTDKEKSAEQKFLLCALVVIVVFTLVFVTVVAVKYDFSAKNFFKPDDLELSSQAETEEDYQLPQVSGKTNYAVFVSEDGELLFAYFLQVDLDNISYKLSAVRASTVCDGSRLGDIFKDSGARSCVNAAETLLSTDFDFYISMTTEQFYKIYDRLGSINYPVLSDIKYKDNSLSVPLNLKIKAGEQTVKASQLVSLVRYYLDAQNNPSVANDILLSALSQQINSQNLENSEELFSLFITNCESNITVRDFSQSGDALIVLCDDRTGVSVYNAAVTYKDGEITQKSLKNAKGYFVK